MQGILGRNNVPSPARQRRHKNAERGKRTKMAGMKAGATLKNEVELLARRKLFNWGVRANSDEELAFAAE
jgi:hypothetical protein